MFKKRSILALLLLIYFSIYTVSPLSASLRTGPADSIIKEKHGSKNISLSLFRVFADLLYQADDSVPSDENATVLIKKKRAVLTSPESIKKLLRAYDSALPVVFDFPEQTVSFRETDNIGTGPYHGFNSTTSGLSPPSL